MPQHTAQNGRKGQHTGSTSVILGNILKRWHTKEFHHTGNAFFHWRLYPILFKNKVSIIKINTIPVNKMNIYHLIAKTTATSALQIMLSFFHGSSQCSIPHRKPPHHRQVSILNPQDCHFSQSHQWSCNLSSPRAVPPLKLLTLPVQS